MIKTLAGNDLTINDVQDGWPALGSVDTTDGRVDVALFAAPITLSHRKRDDIERRFQNPAGSGPIGPGYPALYARRSDAESINRALDDSSWLGRAHSDGCDRQLLNLIGYALAVNSLTLHRHRRQLSVGGDQLAA